MTQSASQRPALEPGLNLIDQRRWADAIAALEQVQLETPGPAATYWLAQARFQQARHAPPLAAAERLAAWRTIAAELAAARPAAGTRVEVDVTLLDLETRMARAELLAALADLAAAAYQRQAGARATLARLAHLAAGYDSRLPDGRWPGQWLLTVSHRPAASIDRCQAWLAPLGAGVWLAQVTAGRGRRRRILGYFSLVVEVDP